VDGLCKIWRRGDWSGGLLVKEGHKVQTVWFIKEIMTTPFRHTLLANLISSTNESFSERTKISSLEKTSYENNMIWKENIFFDCVQRHTNTFFSG